MIFSTSNDPELESRGLSSEHIDEVLGGLARHLFVLGASFTTGGDYRSDGFVDRLLGAAQQYEPEGVVQERFQSHSVWPVHRRWSSKEVEDRQAQVDLVLWPLPSGEEVHGAAAQPEDEPRVWAKALTTMRRSLIEDASCLIAICGKRFDFRGRYPGVLEEVALALEKQIPVYLIAGLGGVAQDVWRTIEAGASEEMPMPPVFDVQEHIVRTSGYTDLVKSLADKPDLRPDFIGMRTRLAQFGLDGLCRGNKLTEDENRRLAGSRNLLEIQALVVKGMSRLARERENSASP